MLAALVSLAACSAGRALSADELAALPRGRLDLGGGGRQKLALQVWIAQTDQTRQSGLMGVKTLSDGQGMAFLFPSPVSEAFWMEDTLIPLDIAFWDGSGRIVKTLTMAPCHADPCPLYPPGVDYVGAVEMNVGLLGRAGVATGDTVRLTRSPARRLSTSATGTAPPAPWPAPAPSSRRSRAPGTGARARAPRSPRPARSRRPA